MRLTGARVPALDGLRGVAVLMVLSAHLGLTPYMNGGYTGVTVFFTLSGFLITTLLLDEREAKGRFNVPAFYGRRFRRLAPALALCVLLAVLVELALLRSVDWVLPLTSLTYTANFEMIDMEFALPTGLGITWSLAIEEQFYLLWPLVLIVTVAWSRRRMLTVLAVACVTSLVLRWWFADGTDVGWARGYFGPDTRADSILIGCALALILRSQRPVGRAALTRGLFWAGTVTLGVLSLLVVQGDRAASGVWLPTATALATAAVIFATVQGGPTFLLDSRLFVWIGHRSYGMYLYQGPVLLLIQQQLGYSRLAAVLFSAPLIVLIAQASYVLMERPIVERGRKVRSGRAAVLTRQVGTVEIHGASVVLADTELDVIASGQKELQ